MTNDSNIFFERGQIADDRKQNILISFSGGRTSAFMALFLKERYPNDNLLFLFSNTGKEKEETLIFVDKCDKEFGLNLVWVEADVNEEKGKGTNYKIVTFETASRNGEPFEAVIKKYGLPSKLFRHCTRELKEIPIHKYAKTIFGNDYVTALGIRADEKHRLKSDPKKIFPLAEIGVDEIFIRGWWKRQSFDLEIKDYEGNCDLCFLKSTRKKLTLISENPNIVEWWNKMEIKYGETYYALEQYDFEYDENDEGFTDVSSWKEHKTLKRRVFDMIGNLSIPELVELAKQPFRKAIDKQEHRENIPQLFEPNFDLEFDCFCKST